MAKLPVVSGLELVKALSKAGFSLLGRQGSHVILAKDTGGRRLKTVVPLHEELDAGTLLAIMRQAEITREDLEKLL